MFPPLLKDKVAWVTGAGRGFGAGIACGLAQAGARVCVTDVNAGELAITQQEIGESLGLSRESASISFRKMYKNGLLKRTDDGQLLIHKEMLDKRL